MGNPLLASAVVSLLAVAAAFAESKVRKTERDRDMYVKIFVGVFLLTYAIMFFKGGGSKSLKKMVGGSSTAVADIDPGLPAF